MMEFVTTPENLPFAVALVVMLAISLIEGLGTILGLSPSALFDSVLPDFDLGVDVDIDVDAPELDVQPSGFTAVLGWLRFGQVPALILLIVFLTAFGLIGLGLQGVMAQTFGSILPASLASIVTFFVSLPVMRVGGGLLGRIMPQDETEAVSEDSFVGLIAVITLGTAKRGHPAQAKLRDAYGQVHYVLVEPDDEDSFDAQSEVLLVSRHGTVFRAIRNTHAALSDERNVR